MIITDKKSLAAYESSQRIWQGIPGIEMSRGGRLFATFYSGAETEDTGNYCLLVKSDDQGRTWSEPIAVIYFDEETRAYDPCLWVDPLGRLWFFFAVMPDHREMAYRCDDPDADALSWSEEIFVGNDVMMNKPTVTKSGKWLLPIAVWRDGVKVKFETKSSPKLSSVWQSTDMGEHFERIGGADVSGRSYDEHMILERADGTLLMLVRTEYGIGKSISHDGGHTWSPGEKTELGGPNSRFCIRRLKSGRVLLINHAVSNSRSHLTAYLSEDDGETFPHSLLLDERPDVSYPDMIEAPDGLIYVVYDRERGAQYKNMRIPSEEMAKEILFCTFREADVFSGAFCSPDSRMRAIISKIGK